MEALLSDSELEVTSVVANCRMNRQRGLSGVNSYSKDLGFDLEQYFQNQPRLSWLDLCCGEGKALRQASERFPDLELCGLDLVAPSQPPPAGLKISVGPLATFQPSSTYDLITCVHGLHYLGDKLGALEKIGDWLSKQGMFLGHLSLENLKSDGSSLSRRVLSVFRHAGYKYDRRRRLIRGVGRLRFGLTYLGADPAAGPNFTGQPAVNSYYAKKNEG